MSSQSDKTKNVGTLKFFNPFTCMIAGPLQSGKTHLTARLLKSSSWLYSETPNKVFYFYNRHIPNNEYLKSSGCEFIEGLPTMNWLQTKSEEFGSNLTIVIDDQALHITFDTAELFTVGCSRFNANIIFLTQNLFLNHKAARDISKNVMYLFLMRNNRECVSLRTFFSQQPEDTSVLKQIYSQYCDKPYSYLFVDMHQKTMSNRKYWTNIFSENGQNPKLFVIEQ